MCDQGMPESDFELAIKRRKLRTGVVVSSGECLAEDDTKIVKPVAIVKNVQDVSIAKDVAICTDKSTVGDALKNEPNYSVAEIGETERTESVKFYDLPTKKKQPKPIDKFTLNPDNKMPTCRFDYAKDLCKDYNESGYCVFGDTCIFLHDRGDYKSGWELELEWESKQTQSEDSAEAAIVSDSCWECKAEFKCPVIAQCSHKFCELCALKLYAATKCCPICRKKWTGSFNKAK